MSLSALSFSCQPSATRSGSVAPASRRLSEGILPSAVAGRLHGSRRDGGATKTRFAPLGRWDTCPYVGSANIFS